MQVTVSSKKYNNKAKSKIKSVISTILIFLFAIISSVVLIVQKKKLLVFDERIFYFVSVCSSRKERDLNTQKELLKNLGGASIVYFYSDNYYLIANAYLELESAEEIKTNLKAYFSEVEILKLKSKKIARPSKKAISSDIGTNNLLKFLYDLCDDYQDLLMNYLNGKTSQGAFLSKLARVRLELDSHNKAVTKDNEVSKNLLASSELIGLGLTNFLGGFEIASSKQNYVCNYFVSFYINYIEMVNCL